MQERRQHVFQCAGIVALLTQAKFTLTDLNTSGSVKNLQTRPSSLCVLAWLVHFLVQTSPHLPSLLSECSELSE